MPVILGANSASGGYDITNSLRFNAGSSDVLTRTPASTSGNQIFTVSFWVKRARLGVADNIFYAYQDGNNADAIGFSSSDTFQVPFYDGGTYTVFLATTQLFRDVSAWYHIVVAIDTTQATASNRAKLYVNGTQVTAFGTETYPSQNTTVTFNKNVFHTLGAGYYGSFSDYNSLYLSEINWITGQQLTPTSFGETDEDTGIWKPKAYTGTFGTNGFYLDFEDSANLGNDMSGNNNDFTVNNLTSIDQSYDSPTNNFATMNPVYRYTYNLTLTEGNLACAGTQAQWQGAIATLGISKGKWYYEAKFTSATGIADFFVGFGGLDDFDLANPYRNNVSFYNSNGGEISVGDTANRFETTSNYGTFANGDIIGVALDYDNELISVYKNGSAIVTNYDYGATSYPSTLINGKTIAPLVAHNGSGSISFNFGNPPFTISSGNADANGYGNFEYAVPSGYYALCTENLAQYG